MIPAPEGRNVVTIGVFDGVHVGHQALVGHARSIADDKGSALIAVTFDPDPMSVLVGPDVVPSLTTVDRRIGLLREAGADRVRVLQFDEELQLTPPVEFVQRYLVDELHASDVVIGPDFQYGYKASGSVSTLRSSGESMGFDVHVVDMVGDGLERWSATRIRSLVAEGRVDEAAVGLSRPHGLEGVVVHGDHRGRELGYPTANLAWQGHPAVPADGVYAAFLSAGSQYWPAAVSVGTNPHFGGQERRVEAYVIDEVGLDLYGESVRIDFVQRVRGQQVFASLDDLVAQMGADVDRARALTT